MVRNKWILLLLCGSWILMSYAMRDPTEPPMKKINSPQETARPVFTIDQILISKKQRIVVINGKTLSVNDSIDRATVIKIERDHVYLKQGSQIIKLSILPDEEIVTQTKS